MSVVKFHFKLQGLEIDVEGTREDIPALSRGIGDQIANIVEPMIRVVEGETAPRSQIQNQLPTLETNTRKKSRRRKLSSSTSGTSNAEVADTALTWPHDPAKYGTPDQAWNTATKSIWLLYVVGDVLKQTSMTAKQIEETFNKNFRQTGQIKNFNVTRDLGKAKGKGKTAPVSEDTAKNPREWYLTESGIRQAQELIASAESK